MAALNPTGEISLSGFEDELFGLLLRVVAEKTPETVLRVAGGWVRDKLLAWESHDIDIALNNCTGIAFAEMVQAVMEAEGEPTHSIGKIKANPEQSKHLETATMLIRGHWVDFVNLRSEEYGDSRIAVSKPGTPEQDAFRRDLTINALFYNINTRSIEDFTGQGLDDLAAGIIRTPLPPKKTFLDDPLRILRAFRFASRYGYAPVPDMIDAIMDPDVRAALAQKVSRERFGIEIASMLRGPAPLLSLAYLTHFGVVPTCFDLPPRAAPAVLARTADGFPPAALAAAASFYALAESPASPGLVSLAVPVPADQDPESESPLDVFRTNVYLAAFLLPRADLTVPAKKGRTTPVAHHHIVSSIKRSNADATFVVTLHAAAAAFADILSGSAEPSRLNIGRILRAGAEDHWDVALALAAISLLPPRDPPALGQPVDAIVASAFPPAAHLDAYVDLHATVTDLFDLAASPPWLLKPALNGSEIIAALNLDRGGRIVGQVSAALIDAQLEAPDRSADEWTEWVVANFA